MNGINIEFERIPEIGFAHHFRMENYRQNFGKLNENSIEIVYVKEGSIHAELYEKTYTAQPGSIMVVPRNRPIKLYAPDSSVRTHCSLQLKTISQMSFIDNASDADKNASGFVVPFINPPCKENEEIKRKLFATVSDISAKGGKASLADKANALAILSDLDNLYRKSLYATSDKASVTEYKIKAYIADNIHRNIPLGELSEHFGRTPGYLNSTFRSSSGISIHQYVNKEKVRIISELILERKLSFRKACESVGIEDISYGYRLFKKQTGLTPGQFSAAKKHFR